MEIRRIHIIDKRQHFLARPSSGLPWVMRVAKEHWASDFVNPRGNHDSSLIAYVQAGRMTAGEPPGQMEAGAGTILYLARENSLTTLRVKTPRGLRVMIITVRGRASNTHVCTAMGRKPRVFEPADCSNIESLFNSMLATADRGYPDAADIVAGLLMPLLRTIRQEHDRARVIDDPGHMLFVRCRDYLTHQYQRIDDTRDLARHFGTTHARLCRLFKRYGERPPYQYLMQRKMLHALCELQQHQRSVGEIAAEMGYADLYSFSKAFKRCMGCSPSSVKARRLPD